jgi:hypothetical protein
MALFSPSLLPSTSKHGAFFASGAAFFAIDATLSGMRAAFFAIAAALSGMHATFSAIDAALSAMHAAFFAIDATFFAIDAAFFATRLTVCNPVGVAGQSFGYCSWQAYARTGLMKPSCPRTNQISTGAPSSTSRVVGMRKKSVAGAALRCMTLKSLSRQAGMPRLGPATIVSRLAK